MTLDREHHIKRGPKEGDLLATQTDLDCQMAIEHTPGAKRHDRKQVQRPGRKA